MSPLPDRPLPAHLEVVPLADAAQAFVSYVDRLVLGVDAGGRPLPDEVRADLALDALAHATSVAERIAAWLPVLARVADASGAAPGDVAERLPGCCPATGAATCSATSPGMLPTRPTREETAVHTPPGGFLGAHTPAQARAWEATQATHEATGQATDRASVGSAVRRP